MKTTIAIVTALSFATHAAALGAGAYWGWAARTDYAVKSADADCPQPQAVFSKSIDLRTGTVTCRYYWEKGARR